jgi:hypothetical protein
MQLQTLVEVLDCILKVSACRCKVERRAVSGQMVLFVKYIDIYVETKSIVVDFNSAIFENVRRPFLF